MGFKIFDHSYNNLQSFRFAMPPMGGVFLPKLWAKPQSIDQFYIKTGFYIMGRHVAGLTFEGLLLALNSRPIRDFESVKDYALKRRK